MPLVKVESLPDFSGDSKVKEWNNFDEITHEWAEAIANDDLESAKKMLQKSATPDKLINGFSAKREQEIFSTQNHDRSTRSTCATRMEEMPWWLVVAGCASQNLLPLFLSHNVFIHATEKAVGNNFVHVLVVMDMHNPQNTGCYIQLFQILKKSLKHSDLKKLLMHENKQGLRPMELAAKYGCWPMFLSLFACLSTERVRCAHAVINYHLITEYEEHSRMSKSPLSFLQDIDMDTLADLAERNLIPDLLKTWSQFHIQSQNPLVYFVVVWYVIIPGLFAVFDSYVASVSDNFEFHVDGSFNDSRTTCLTKSHSTLIILRSGLILSLCAGCLVLFLYCTGLWVVWVQGKLQQKKQNHFSCCIPGMKRPFYNKVSHIWMQSAYCVLLSIAVCIDLLIYFKQIQKFAFIQDVLFYVVMTLSMLTLFQWATFSNNAGTDFLILRAMAHHLIHCLFFFPFVGVPFVLAILRLSRRSKALCDHNLGLNMDTFYEELFLASVSFGPLPYLDTMEKYERVAVMVIHMIFIMLAGIVLMNFLIALFSCTAADVMQCKDLILLLTRLQVSLDSERMRNNKTGQNMKHQLHQTGFAKMLLCLSVCVDIQCGHSSAVSQLQKEATQEAFFSPGG